MKEREKERLKTSEWGDAPQRKRRRFGGGLDVLPAAQRLTVHLGKTRHFYNQNLSDSRSLMVKMDG